MINADKLKQLNELLDTGAITQEEFEQQKAQAFAENKKALSGEKLLVQGIIDCAFFDENGELILVDYKTDKADSTELLSRYLKQLYLYRMAAEKAYGLPVTKVYIWSFYLSEAIDCTPYLQQ